MTTVRIPPLAAVASKVPYHEVHDVSMNNMIVYHFIGGQANSFNIPIAVPKSTVGATPKRVMMGFIENNNSLINELGVPGNVTVAGENTYTIGGVRYQLPLTGNVLNHLILNPYNLSFTDRPLTDYNLDFSPTLLGNTPAYGAYAWPSPTTPAVNGATTPFGAILPAFDGTLDFSGNSGYSARTISTRQVPMPFGEPGSFIQSVDPVKNANFVGSGTVQMYACFRPRKFFQGFPSGHWGPMADEWFERLPTFRVIYEY